MGLSRKIKKLAEARQAQTLGAIADKLLTNEEFRTLCEKTLLKALDDGLDDFALFVREDQDANLMTREALKTLFKERGVDDTIIPDYPAFENIPEDSDEPPEGSSVILWLVIQTKKGAYGVFRQWMGLDSTSSQTSERP